MELSIIEDRALELGVHVRGLGHLGGWTGGRLVLVPTDKPIDQWIPIAQRGL